jgi:hypothetical protein
MLSLLTPDGNQPKEIGGNYIELYVIFSNDSITNAVKLFAGEKSRVPALL